jgi:AAA+ superfamily predicted ATPase
VADDPLISSLRRAVEATPADVPLRLHLAELLIGRDRAPEAVQHLGVVLGQAPADSRALDLMRRALAAPAISPSQTSTTQPSAGGAAQPQAEPRAESIPGQTRVPGDAQDTNDAHDAADGPGEAPADSSTDGAAVNPTDGSADSPTDGSADSSTDAAAGASIEDSFDWDAAARDLGEIAQPLFVGDDGERLTEPAYDLESSSVSLADVGGMEQVKQRLEVAFLAPMRNPELSRMYHKSLKGGLLLYGPPGCGKTFIARAVAGELGANFISVTLADILDMYIGNSERNLSEIFATARRNAPCVLFFDEIDAIGQKRSQLRNNAARGVVNQFLTELDGVDAANEGVFVLAATNAPWDVDVALRRPGRLDRTLLVLPPDQPAREAILRHHLKDRPVSGVKLGALAKKTEGYSGADLAHVCETAAELALMDSARTGQVRLIGMADLEAAVSEVRPSVGAWLESARNVALFANESGTYDDLATYLKKRRML